MLELYPYQAKGVEFMRERGHVLLADEMGLGKTAQAIKASVDNDGIVLIISSKGMKYFWQAEIIKWTGCDKDCIWIPGANNDVKTLLVTEPPQWTIVHWDILRRWDQLWTMKWHTVIVDEAHKAKNRKAQRTQALWKICRNAENVFLLTGTPVVNEPADLWSLLKCLYPKTYTSYWAFYKKYVLFAPTPWSRYSGEVLGVRNKEQLDQELAPIVIRRLKKTVMPELPDKTYTFIPIELHPEQLRAYKEMVELMIAEIDDETTVLAPTVLAQIIRLRQICVGHGAFTEPEKWGSIWSWAQAISPNPLSRSGVSLW